MNPDRPNLIGLPSTERAAGFDAVYEGTPPWEIGGPQPALAGLGDAIAGRVIDVGCGTGEHAMFAAGRGAEATGVDLSSRAIGIGRERAAARGLDVRFIVGDVLRLAEVAPGPFDVALDSGVFHTFNDDERPVYAGSVASVVRPDGLLFLMCFSDREPGTWGPRRVSDAELRAAFDTGWEIESIQPATFTLTGRAGIPSSVLAWLARIRRL